MSKEKGKIGEREVAALFREHGFDARRGVQFQGGNESPDVVVPPDLPIHVEVKRTERFNLYQAMEQAVEDAGPGEIPTVWHRQSRKGWVVVISAEDFLILLKQATRSDT